MAQWPPPKYATECLVVRYYYYTEHCSVWSYQTYRDYYRQYGTDEDFG